MKRSGSVRRVKVSADGVGVVSYVGLGVLRELAGDTGLVAALNRALADTYRGPWLHAPGRVLTDLAVAVADGADAITGIEVLGDRQGVFGPVASMLTAWRVLDRVDADHLGRVRAARGLARARAWAGGAGPDLSQELRIDFDATITVAHSEKENAAATWKKTFGFHPLLAFLDRSEIAGGEALAGLLRPGNAGSNTAADHVVVLQLALAALPAHARPRPGEVDSPRVLARSDSAGATHAFAAVCRAAGVGFSFGFPIDFRVQAIVDAIPDECWHPAIDTGDQFREGAWVAEATGTVDLSSWPA
ncbi:MAG: transposase, partial [Acidimicrobiales bacterium]